MKTKTTRDPNRPPKPVFATGNDKLVYVDFSSTEAGLNPRLMVDGPRGGHVLVAGVDAQRLRRFAERIIANLDYMEAQRPAVSEGER